MKNIVIQAGHINCQNNIDVGIRKSTGAPGEQELTKRVADMTSSMLRDRGFAVIQTDANANSDKSITEKDFDLFLALHGDADAANDQGGGMIGSGDKLVDHSWVRSAEIASIMKGVYFKESGIVDKNFVTTGMTKYYMWKYLTAKTPCVLLEMGQVQDSHDKVLLADTYLIASSIVRAICKVFGVLYDLPDTTPVVDTPQVTQLKKDLQEAKDALANAKVDFARKIADKENECQKYIDILKQISVISTL